MPNERAVRIADIKIGKRHRANNGNLAPLKASIQSLGILHPIGVNSRLELKYGGRRLAACIELGWEEVPVRVLESLDDVVQGLLAERDENVCREPMLATDAVQLGKELEKFEREEAKKRKSIGQNQHTEPAGNLPEGSKGDTRDKVAAALGMSGKNYEKAKSIIEEGVEGLVELMNKGDVSIDAAAKIAALSEDEQEKVVAGGKDAIKEKVAKIRAAEKAEREANKGKSGGNAPGPSPPQKPSEPVNQDNAEAGDQTTDVQVGEEPPAAEEPAEDESTVMGKLNALLKEVKKLVKKNPLLAKDAAVAIHEVGAEVIEFTPPLKFGEQRAIYDSPYFRNKSGVYEGPTVQHLEGIGSKAIDTYGRPVPQHLRDEFCDDGYTRIGRHLELAVAELQQADDLYQKMSARPMGVHWCKTQTWNAGFTKAAQMLDDVTAKWWSESVPFTVCRFCMGAMKNAEGIRCLKCNFSGYWPRSEARSHPTMIQDKRPKATTKQEVKS